MQYKHKTRLEGKRQREETDSQKGQRVVKYRFKCRLYGQQ